MLVVAMSASRPDAGRSFGASFVFPTDGAPAAAVLISKDRVELLLGLARCADAEFLRAQCAKKSMMPLLASANHCANRVKREEKKSGAYVGIAAPNTLVKAPSLDVHGGCCIMQCTDGRKARLAQVGQMTKVG